MIRNEREGDSFFIASTRVQFTFGTGLELGISLVGPSHTQKKLASQSNTLLWPELW